MILNFTDFYLSWYCCKRRWKHRAPLHRRRELADSGCSFRGWYRRICICIRHCILCLYVPFPSRRFLIPILRVPLLSFNSLTLHPDGGTESIAITAGETASPHKNIPRVIKNVFWRILLFYILSILLIGLNIPYNTPGLKTKSSTTSPFTLVFQMAGAKVAGSFINAMIMTSVISAGNHALFAGTRLLYTLAVNGHAPSFFGNLNRNRVPWIAVLATSAISGICFGASFIGAGQLWSWLQNIVGVSNQLSWIAIGIASLRFRAGLAAQNKTHLLTFRNFTYPYGPWAVVLGCSFLVLVQGWSCFSPVFSGVDFVSYYIELPIMLLMFGVWKLVKRTRWVSAEEMDLETDVYLPEEGELDRDAAVGWKGKARAAIRWIF